MNFFRKLITSRELTAFIALGMLLRSVIAVGYMLDTNPENGDLFSIMLCDGPAGINAIAGITDNTDSHAHDHALHSHDHHSNNDTINGEHKHAASQDHPASSCSFWSASSLSLLTETSFVNTADYFLSNEIVIYESNLKRRLSNNARFARAPPTSA